MSQYPKSYSEYITKYNDYRRIIYQQTPQLVNIPGVSLTPINSKAVSEHRKWVTGRNPPNGGWDWGSWVEKYRRSYGKRLELAIWHNNTTLCGLALGKASGANIHVRLEVLEGAPGQNNPLKGSVAFIALTALELYGTVCDSEEARIIDPVDGAIRVYEKYGYKLMPSTKSHPRYLMKKLNP